MPANKLLTVPEVAERLRLKPETVRVKLRRGEIAGTRTGPQGPHRRPQWRVTERALRNWMAENEQRTEQ